MSNLNGFTNFIELDIDGNGVFYPQALQTIGGNATEVLRLNTEEGQLRAYNECPPIKAIIGKRAKAFNNAEISIVNKETGEVSTDSGMADILAKLNRPNPLQTRKQFLAQQNSYIDLHGWCIMLKTSPVGFSKKVTNLWNLPPWLITDVKFTGQWRDQTTYSAIISSFTLTMSGQVIPLDPNDAVMIMDDGFGTDMDLSFTISDSRLKGYDLPVSTIRAAYKGWNTLISKKGMIGILSNQAKDISGHVPMKNGEKANLQREFKKYGITGQEWQVLITEAHLNWQSMSYPIKDMLLDEAISNGTMALCDVYGVPYRLMASEKSASYNDVKEFGKQFYQETIIPEDESRWEQRSNALIGYDSPYKFETSFGKVAALQVDQQATATVRKLTDEAAEKEFRNNAITLNMWLADIGKEPRTDGNGDKYYYQLLQEGWVFGNTTQNGGDNMATQNNSANNSEIVN